MESENKDTSKNFDGFFTDEELKKLREQVPQLLSIKNEEPYLNYEPAMNILNDVTHAYWSGEVIWSEKNMDENECVFEVLYKITIRKGDKERCLQNYGSCPISKETYKSKKGRLATIEKDLRNAKYSEDEIKEILEEEKKKRIISNSGQYRKAAVTDAIKKIMMSMCEIGQKQVMDKKSELKKDKETRNSYKSGGSNSGNYTGKYFKCQGENCSDEKVPEVVAEFSKKHYDGKIYCRECQQKHQKTA